MFKKMFMKKTGRKFRTLSEIEANELRFRQMKEAEAAAGLFPSGQPVQAVKIETIAEQREKLKKLELEIKARVEGDPKLCKVCEIGTTEVDHEYNYTTNKVTHVVKCSYCSYKRVIDDAGKVSAFKLPVPTKKEEYPDDQIRGFNIEDEYSKEEHPDLFKKEKKVKDEDE